MIEDLCFQHLSKGIKSKHIECKMRNVSMDKAVRNEPVYLSPPDGGRIKDQIVDHSLIAESSNRNKTGDYYDDEGDCELHLIKIRENVLNIQHRTRNYEGKKTL